MVHKHFILLQKPKATSGDENVCSVWVAGFRVSCFHSKDYITMLKEIETRGENTSFQIWNEK